MTSNVLLLMFPFLNLILLSSLIIEVLRIRKLLQSMDQRSQLSAGKSPGTG